MYSEYKCDAPFKDPFFKGKKCDSTAKWKIRLNDNEDYMHPRCGRHTYKYDKILINKKKDKLNKINYTINDEICEDLKFNFEELLKYIESEDIKKDIPQEVNDLYKALDDINYYITMINSK